MRKLIVILVLLSILPFFYSCGFREGVIQPDNQSYIWFSGNTESAIASIDNEMGFKIEPNFYLDNQGNKINKSGKALYEVKPGKHEIVVKRNNEIIVNRIIMISAGATKEVRVP
jgi:hypothetical protein